MKISKLKNIIKESIKELVNEQNQLTCYTCINGTIYSTNNFSNTTGPYGPQAPNVNICGQVPISTGTSYTNFTGTFNMGSTLSNDLLFFDSTSNPYFTALGCTSPNTNPQGPCTVYGCTDPNATNYNPTILPHCDTGCFYGNGGTTSGCGECDASAWPNYNNWVSTWSNSGPFNSFTNPNQPCNYICQKMTQWNNKCMGNQNDTQTNILSCKLEEGYEQAMTNGCNC